MLYFAISKRNSLPIPIPIPIEKFVEEEEEEAEAEVSFDSDQKFSSASAPTGDLLSESECADDNFTTTEESEVEWPFSDRTTAHNPDRSDGSISDEESLIEIALPTGHYVSHKFDDDEEDEDEDDMSFHLQKLSDFQKQKNLVELLAEINDINEEENLIEIDISMGSIKYSRFEIEA